MWWLSASTYPGSTVPSRPTSYSYSLNSFAVSGQRCVDDNGCQPLQPLHALVHTSRPFDSLTAEDAKSAVIGAGFHLCGIGGHALPRFNTLLHQLCGFLVGGTQPGQFIEDIQRFACRIIVAAVERPRVGIPPPVNTVFNGVEVSDSLLRDRLKPQIFKYLRAAADDLAQIFMAVFRRCVSLMYSACARNFGPSHAAGACR